MATWGEKKKTLITYYILHSNKKYLSTKKSRMCIKELIAVLYNIRICLETGLITQKFYKQIA